MSRPRQLLVGILLGLALAAVLAPTTSASTPAPVARAQPAAAKGGADADGKAEPLSFVGQGWG